jgi:trimethylamine-N-oxide reductase (cytochrome c)
VCPSGPSRLWPGLATKVTSLIHGNGGPGIRGPYSTEPARWSPCSSHAGLGKPGVHQAKMIEWWFWREWNPLPYQGTIRPDIPNFVELCRRWIASTRRE